MKNAVINGSYIESIIKYVNKDEKVFFVIDKALLSLVNDSISNTFEKYVVFSSFGANPKYENIKEGLKQLKEFKSEIIVSIGGGSAIDTAKIIKLLSSSENELDFLENKFVNNDIFHIAIPTTAGTGSESTRVAVMYYNNEKLSLYDDSLVPNVAVLDYELLKSLPIEQKKMTLADALCQGIESFWSLNSDDESEFYAKECMNIILDKYHDYINNNDCLEEMLIAANYSGKAICISKTGIPHSMSYILTNKYGVSHGYAVIQCLIPVFKAMINYSYIDENLRILLDRFAISIGERTVNGALKKIEDFYNYLDLPKCKYDINDLQLFVDSVNMERMNIFPVKFTREDICEIYKNIINDQNS